MGKILFDNASEYVDAADFEKKLVNGFATLPINNDSVQEKMKIINDNFQETFDSFVSSKDGDMFFRMNIVIYSTMQELSTNDENVENARRTLMQISAQIQNSMLSYMNKKQEELTLLETQRKIDEVEKQKLQEENLSRESVENNFKDDKELELRELQRTEAAKKELASREILENSSSEEMTSFSKKKTLDELVLEKIAEENESAKLIDTFEESSLSKEEKLKVWSVDYLIPAVESAIKNNVITEEDYKTLSCIKDCIKEDAIPYAKKLFLLLEDLSEKLGVSSDLEEVKEVKEFKHVIEKFIKFIKLNFD
jgi:hypothetical protein